MSGATTVLPWLLAPPDDFRTKVKALFGEAEVDLLALRRLSATGMDVDQLGRLGKAASSAAERLAQSGFTRLKLGLVGSHTLDYVAQVMVATGLRYGLLLEIVRADYGQVFQPISDPMSALGRAKVDAVLLSLDPTILGLASPRLDESEAKATIDAAIGQLKMLRNGIRDNLEAMAVLQTLPLSPDPLFGSLDFRVAGSPHAMIEAFNRRLMTDVIDSGDLVVDVGFAAASYGLNNWFDPRVWHSAKLPFALEVTPLYADHVCRVLAASKGKVRKCLVLDLDNTLWGGIIGDDGLEGIRLGQGDSLGEAYLAIQTLALELHRRGVILAVCSKNDETNARLPFREHKDMILREDHIACFVANWTDKAANLRTIASTLNIGLDALVFLDDNPAERDIIRSELPEVAVPEVGDDPSLYPAMLARAGYFEAISFAEEDRKRADYYRANVERKSVAAAATNLGEYLASLNMVMTVAPFDAQGRARIAQLINKSNQFNLTTRRYGEREVAALEENPNKFTLQVRLTDKFGDNGMISVIIFEKLVDSWQCDTWLMSCRVLGRQVEEAVLSVIANAAHREGAGFLRGCYIPTPKNGLVAEHFSKLGFTKISQHPDGGTDWELRLADYAQPKLPIEIVRDKL